MLSCVIATTSPTAIPELRSNVLRFRNGAPSSTPFSGDLLNPIPPAFRDTVRRFSIPAQYFHWIIDGAQMDLDVFQYETFRDLYAYCFNVASAVGLVCLHIFGFGEERAKKHAEQCGIAFQLTNILRDVKEDTQMGRIYLPAEDLKRFDYAPADLRQGIVDERFRRLMKFEADRARQYYSEARSLMPLVEETSRPALWAMMAIYERILDRIVQKRYDVFRVPIHLSGTEKILIALQALLKKSFGKAGWQGSGRRIYEKGSML
jgi:phytoene synthase